MTSTYRSVASTQITEFYDRIQWLRHSKVIGLYIHLETHTHAPETRTRTRILHGVCGMCDVCVGRCDKDSDEVKVCNT
jgi:hypothetical protein